MMELDAEDGGERLEGERAGEFEYVPEALYVCAEIFLAKIRHMSSQICVVNGQVALR